MANKINKRKIFYLCGFDPRGPSAYHTLYREESAKHSLLSGKAISVSGRTNKGKHVSTWHIEQEDVAADYDFLRWDDVIRKNWIKNPLKLFIESIRMYIHMIGSGAHARISKGSRNLGISIIYPMIAILAILLLSYLAGSLIAKVTAPFIGWIVFILLAGLGIKLSAKLSILWLLRIYIFVTSESKKRTPEVVERVSQFAEYVSAELNKNEYDEYLLIGHSVGSIMLVMTLAEVIRAKPHTDLSKLKAITIGQCLNGLSYFPHSQYFRDDLKIIAEKNLVWLDVGAPSDGVCFALFSPFEGACENKNVRLKLMSPKFHKMISADKYRKLKLNKFRMHFQYLMSGDKLTDYNFFDITAGNLPLEERYGIL